MAQFLATHPEVATVTYPGLKSGEEKRRADAIFEGGYGGLVGFELKGGSGCRSSVHRCAASVLSRGQYRRRAVAGDPPGDHDPQPARPRGTAGVGRFGRLCPAVVGIEHIDDILEDLTYALDAAGAVVQAAE